MYANPSQTWTRRAFGQLSSLIAVGLMTSSGTCDEPEFYEKTVAQLIKSLQEGDDETREESAFELVQRSGVPKDVSSFIPELTEALKDRSPIVREQAMNVLADLGIAARSSASSVHAALNDRDKSVRIAAVRTLRSVSADAVPAVINSARHDPSCDVRRAAIKSLGFLPYSPETGATVLHLLKHDEDVDVRYEAACYVEEYLDERDWMDALPELTKGATSSSFRHQFQSIRVIGLLGPKAVGAAPALAESLTHPDMEIRFGAAESLAAVGKIQESLPLLIEILRDPGGNLPLTYQATVVLERIGPAAKPALPVLLDALKSGYVADTAPAVRRIMGAKASVAEFVKQLEHPSSEVRHGVVLALGDMGPEAKPAADILVRVLREDQDESVRDAAAFELGRIGADGADVKRALRAALEDEHMESRISAAGTLASFGHHDEAVLKILFDAIASETPQERWGAAHGLRFVASDGAIAALLDATKHDDDTCVISRDSLCAIGSTAVPDLLSAIDSRDEGRRVTAISCLGRIGVEAREAIPALIQIVQSNEPTETNRTTGFLVADILPGTAIDALASMVAPKDKVAVPWLVLGLTFDNTYWREAAASGLQRIGPPAISAKPALEIATTDPDRKVRRAAKTALEAISGAVARRAGENDSSAQQSPKNPDTMKE